MYSEYQLSTTVNNNTPQGRLLVSLSNGDTLIQDNIPNTPHFWKRLKKLIAETDISVTMVRYQSDQTIVSMPSNCKHYYFMNAQSGNVGETCVKSIKIGYANDSNIIIVTEIGQYTQKQQEIPFSRGGIGIISNIK